MIISTFENAMRWFAQLAIGTLPYALHPKYDELLHCDRCNIALQQCACSMGQKKFANLQFLPRSDARALPTAENLLLKIGHLRNLRERQRQTQPLS
jgi:hypothetical protein